MVTTFTFNNCSTFCIPFLISFLGSLLKRRKLHNSGIFLPYVQRHTPKETFNLGCEFNPCPSAEKGRSSHLSCRWTRIHRTDLWRERCPPGFGSLCTLLRTGEGKGCRDNEHGDMSKVEGTTKEPQWCVRVHVHVKEGTWCRWRKTPSSPPLAEAATVPPALPSSNLVVIAWSQSRKAERENESSNQSPNINRHTISKPCTHFLAPPCCLQPRRSNVFARPFFLLMVGFLTNAIAKSTGCSRCC